MDTEIVTQTENIQVFINDSPILALFFFCMWGITLMLLVRKSYPTKYNRIKPRKVNDKLQLLRAYLVLPSMVFGNKNIHLNS